MHCKLAVSLVVTVILRRHIHGHHSLMVGRLSPMCTNTIGLQQMGHGEKTRHPGKKMSQLEELKSFVSERLNAVATEIVGAIEKTITDYEEQAFRLREENERHRSLLDIILRTKLPPQPEGWSSRHTRDLALSPLQTEIPLLTHFT